MARAIIDRTDGKYKHEHHFSYMRDAFKGNDLVIWFCCSTCGLIRQVIAWFEEEKNGGSPGA